MAGSQLKQLKASLRERGRLGPTPSKKEKKKFQETRRKAKQDLPQDIAPVKKAKFDFVNASDKNGSNKDSAARERREQARRNGILFEMQHRQKVGGIIDRRFGEDDPTMTPEERAMERFVREKQRSGRKSAVFDLEDDDGDEAGGLTHLGRPLGLKDDFHVVVSDDDISGEGDERGKKRRRLSDLDVEDAERENEDPFRPKTKKEIMKEVVAKSKLHKYERQKAKEDDDELRAELDAGVADIFALMSGRKAAPKVSQPMDIPMNPERAALLNGQDRDKADREYDLRLRAMVQDKRSQPTSRTKTEEEKAEEEAYRLKRLEEQRLRRMNGEDSDDDDIVGDVNGDDDFYGDVNDPVDTQAMKVIQNSHPRALLRQQDIEDEDEFELDHDLVADDSDLEALQSDESSIADEDESEDDDQEFIADLHTIDQTGKIGLKPGNRELHTVNGSRSHLAYTYDCPQNLAVFLEVEKDVPLSDLPIVVQRIRALYHPQLAEGNKDRLAQFAAVLVEFVSHISRQKTRPTFVVLESLIRHIHSLARSFPESVSEAFRGQLQSVQKNRPSNLDAGDLVILTAIGTIYPTSDHFHQVVTPAILTMARYLELAVPSTTGDLITGTYVSTLALSYQKLSQRYVPEVVNYILNAIARLAPEPSKKTIGPYPDHNNTETLRIDGTHKQNKYPSTLSFWDIDTVDSHNDSTESIKLSLLTGQLLLIDTIISQWSHKSAFPEIIAPIALLLAHLLEKQSLRKLPLGLQDAIRSTQKNVDASIQQVILLRKPLALHSHRPLGIKMSVPKFEESYNPEKRYDPDTERAESSKLRAEHRKERKAVIREFRKEARAEASVQLEEKKARDEAYEKNYRRLVAEIQGEEGREAKAYEREKSARKSKQ